MGFVYSPGGSPVGYSQLILASSYRGVAVEQNVTEVVLRLRTWQWQRGQSITDVQY